MGTSSGYHYTMAINIKRERVHELARQASALTGTSQTDVIESALERYLADLLRKRRPSRRERVDALLTLVDAEMTAQTRTALTTDNLYDDAGLPR